MVKKKEMKSHPENEGDMLNRLSAGLSEQEIRCVLAGALSDLDHAEVDRLLKRVGHETTSALRGVLHADSSKRPPVPGKAKVKEEWEKAWDHWNSLIEEASQGEGQYVIQEHHWEEPYFDPGSVTLALEPMKWPQSEAANRRGFLWRNVPGRRAAKHLPRLRRPPAPSAYLRQSIRHHETSAGTG